MKFHNGIAVVEGDSHLSKWVIEQNTLEVQRKYWLMFAKHIPVGSVVLDVGACLGDSAATFSALVGPTGQVWAFEPNPSALECLEHNMEKYPNVTVYGCGLGDQRQSVGIHHAELTQLNLGATQLRGEGHIPIWSLDMITMGRGEKISFIKIDAEGWEPRIITGGMDTIRRHRPVMVIEINRPILKELGFSDKDVTFPLNAIGYTITPSEPHIPWDSEMLDILCLP